MLKRVLLVCTFLMSQVCVSAQLPPNKAGASVEVVATAFEYVPRSKTISRPGHSLTSCQGDTSYFGQFQSYGSSGSVSGTAETTTQCSSTFSLPTESTVTTYLRVNYTIVRGDQTLYLLSCTQPTESTVERARNNGLISVLARSTCPAFLIGSKYILTVRNTSDARLTDTNGGKPSKVEYLTSVALPPVSPAALVPRQNVITTQEQTRVHITSSPAGGEIYLDGKFVGNTPSEIAVPAGEHVFRVTFKGREWVRTVRITGGEINLYAEIPQGN